MCKQKKMCLYNFRIILNRKIKLIIINLYVYIIKKKKKKKSIWFIGLCFHICPFFCERQTANFAEHFVKRRIWLWHNLWGLW